MTYKYAIFSIDDTRKNYTDKIRETLSAWEEIDTECVDGRVPEVLASEIIKHGYEIKYGALVGQLGIWYTVLNAIEDAPLITLEDDALLGVRFIEEFEKRIAELPEDADFFSLFLPRDSNHMFTEDKTVSYHLCKTYQRYGGVSMFYTERGVEKIKALLKRDGITGQYDDTLYQYSKTGELNGYCSKPCFPDLVYISGLEKSIVQETVGYE